MSPRAFGSSVLSARLRENFEDFIVDEMPGFPPSGQGEHLLLTLRKIGLTTSDVVQRLCRWAAIAPVGIGYAGLKDKHAVTTQRFSVHLPRKVAPDLADLQGEGLQVIEHAWHSRKLPRGALAGNRFALRLRGVEGDASAIAERVSLLASRGMPNRFGDQRFGRRGDNLVQAQRMFAGMRVGREQRSILLSAVRSALFNAVLDARVSAGCWDVPLAGDVFMLEGSHSVFGPESVSEILWTRCRDFDIHPTGPLWGRGVLRTSDQALAMENDALVAFEGFKAGLEQAGLSQERRALRVRIGDLDAHWEAPDTLRLSFTLPAGCYATALLWELGDVVDSRRLDPP